MTNQELIFILQSYPLDAEVLFEINDYHKTSIAFINGIKFERDFNEIRLMN